MKPSKAIFIYVQFTKSNHSKPFWQLVHGRFRTLGTSNIYHLKLLQINFSKYIWKCTRNANTISSSRQCPSCKCFSNLGDLLQYLTLYVCLSKICLPFFFLLFLFLFNFYIWKEELLNYRPCPTCKSTINIITIIQWQGNTATQGFKANNRTS